MVVHPFPAAFIHNRRTYGGNADDLSTAEDRISRATLRRGERSRARRFGRMIAAANEAGWGTEEITAALLKAAQFMSDATKKDPDPADDPSISDAPAVQEQIGHGELYD